MSRRTHTNLRSPENNARNLSTVGVLVVSIIIGVIVAGPA